MNDKQVTWAELQSLALNRLWKGTKSEATASVNTASAVAFFGGATPLKDLSVQQIDAYVESLQNKQNTNGTINRKLSALSKMLRFGLEREFITKIPRIEKKKEATGRIRWLTKSEEHPAKTGTSDSTYPKIIATTEKSPRQAVFCFINLLFQCLQ